MAPRVWRSLDTLSTRPRLTDDNPPMTMRFPCIYTALRAFAELPATIPRIEADLANGT
jgi:hypothetical protein